MLFGGGVKRHLDSSNAGVGQSSDGHLAVCTWPARKVGGAITVRMSWKVTRTGLEMRERALALRRSRNVPGESRSQNRKIRASGSADREFYLMVGWHMFVLALRLRKNPDQLFDNGRLHFGG